MFYINVQYTIIGGKRAHWIERDRKISFQSIFIRRFERIGTAVVPALPSMDSSGGWVLDWKIRSS